MAAKALSGEEYSRALIRAAQTGVVPGGLTREDAANIRATISNPSTRNQVLKNVKATPPKQEVSLKQTQRQQPAAKPAPTGKNTKQEKPAATILPSDQQQPQLEAEPNQRSRYSTEGTTTSQRFDIRSFRTEILENGVLPSHSYLVTFSPFRTGFPENTPLTQFITQKRNTLVLRCESIILPTPSLLEEENIRRYGYGPVEKIPYGVQFSDVTMTWLVDKNSELIDFMHQWMNTIVMHDSPSTMMTPSLNPDEQRLDLTNYSPFEVGYKDSYANPIVRIYVYNRQNQTVIEYEMYDVFPMNIQSMNLSWADENQDQKLTVTFAYTNMKVKAKMKTTETQLNYLLEGRLSNPYEERIQPANKGGKAAADKAVSPVNENFTTTAGTTNPNSTENTPSAPTGVIVNANSITRRTLNP